MAFSLEAFEDGTDESYHQMSGGIHKGGPVQLLALEDDWGDSDIFCSCEEDITGPTKGGFLQSYGDMHQQTRYNIFPDSDVGVMDDISQIKITPPPYKQVPEDPATLDRVVVELSDLIQPEHIEKPCNPTTLASPELLNGYKGCKYNMMNGEKLNEQQQLAIQPCGTVGDYQRLSTEEVMRVAGVQYLQSSVPKDDSNLTIPLHPFGCAFSGLSEEEIKDLELARLLLASAEKIGNQQYDRGSKLLFQCANLSSDTGNPIQRVAYYFSEGLQERIDRETGRFASKGAKGRGRHASDADLKEIVVSPKPAIPECYKSLPFSQITLFTAIQAIVQSLGSAKKVSPKPAIPECYKSLPFSQITLFMAMQAIVQSLGSAKKVHLIDLGLKTGIPWTILMQALEARKDSPIETLKITAVGTINQQEIWDTGKMLTSFAESMGFCFSFNVVMVENLEDIEEELFELEDGESIAVYSAFVLRTMLTRSDRLDSLMSVIRNISPCIMLVTEVEGNHNSPSFSNRFVESLFYFSAFFDCLETFMDRNNENRMKTEAFHFGEAIKNILATEGEERIFQNVGIDVWRPFFARFRMAETELSYSSMYQANSIKKKFAYGSDCTLDMNGKCIIVVWKGTPSESLSAWKFSLIRIWVYIHKFLILVKASLLHALHICNIYTALFS